MTESHIKGNFTANLLDSFILGSFVSTIYKAVHSSNQQHKPEMHLQNIEGCMRLEILLLV
jgi:fluoride ion exporter CrcB/FEX